MYLNSDNVAVFPSAKRANATSTYNSARELNEKNVTGLLRNSIEKESYIIDIVNNSMCKASFVLGGYYFESTFNASSSVQGNLYVGINVTDGEIVGQDDNSEYKGLYVTDQINSTYSNMTYKLQLLYAPDNSTPGKPCEQNFYRFTSKSIENIDGGKLN